MKKLIMSAMWIFVIVAIGYIVYDKIIGPPSGIENVLPQNVSVFVKLQDVEKNLETLTSMPIWQGLSRIDLDSLMRKNVIDDQQAMMIDLIKTQLKDVINSPLAKKLFGHDVAIAIYPLDLDINLLVQEIKTLNPKSIEDLFSGIFLVTRVDADVQLAEFVSRFFNRFGSNVSQGQVEYKGEVIRTITISDVGIKIGIVRLKNLLVIGIGEKAVRTSIDVYKRDEPSLAKDPQFAKIQKKFLKHSNMVGYFNFAEFLKEFKDQGEKLMSLGGGLGGNIQSQVQWEKILARTTGLKAFAFSSQLTPILRVDSQLIFDSDELDAEYALLYTCPSSKNKTLEFTPQDVLGYHWSNCFKLDYYWEKIIKELERTKISASRIDDFETTIGLSVTGDILPAFGEEIGGYILDVLIEGLVPMPKILLFVEVANKSKAEGLLKKLEELPLVMFQDENYNGTSIKYIALPLGQDVQPGYAFLGDYLLISTSRNLIKQSIDASENSDLSLPSNLDFKEIDYGLTDKNRSVQFLKVGQVIERVKEIIRWSNQWMAAKDRKAEAFKTGSAKPLEEVKVSIALKESELKAIRERLILTEDEIWNMESKGLDVSTKQIELNELQDQLDVKKEEIIAENERKEGLVNIVGELDSKSPDPEMRQFYLEKIVYPVLDSLKYIKSFGLRSTVSDDVFDSSVILSVTY